MNAAHFSALATQFLTFLIAQCATRGQNHFKNTPQLIFWMLPTSPGSLVNFGQFLIFLIPRVPSLDNFQFLDRQWALSMGVAQKLKQAALNQLLFKTDQNKFQAVLNSQLNGKITRGKSLSDYECWPFFCCSDPISDFSSSPSAPTLG